MMDEEAGLRIFAAYLKEAEPLLSGNFGGQDRNRLMDGQLAALGKIATEIPLGDNVRRGVVEQIRGDLGRIALQYEAQLPELSRRVDHPAVGFKLIGASALIGGFLGFIMAFGWYKYRQYQV
jgi:hypothetical protein